MSVFQCIITIYTPAQVLWYDSIHSMNISVKFSVHIPALPGMLEYYVYPSVLYCHVIPFSTCPPQMTVV